MACFPRPPCPEQLLLALAAYCVHPGPADALLGSFYLDVLLPSGLLHAPMCEAVWASLSFVVWGVPTARLWVIGVKNLDGSVPSHAPAAGTWWWWGANAAAYLGSIWVLHQVWLAT